MASGKNDRGIEPFFLLTGNRPPRATTVETVLSGLATRANLGPMQHKLECHYGATFSRGLRVRIKSLS